MTAPKPMDPFELEACERYIKGGEMLMGAPGDIERQLSDWCEALLVARDHHAAEVERLRPVADAAELVRETVDDLRRRSEACTPFVVAHMAAGRKIDAERCMGKRQAYAHAARLLIEALRVSPRASEGAATPTQEELDVSAERQLLAQYAAAGEAGRAGGLVAVIEVAATPTPCAVCGWACMGHATSEPERGEP